MEIVLIRTFDIGGKASNKEKEKKKFFAKKNKPVAGYKCEFINSCHYMQEVLKIFIIFYIFLFFTHKNSLASPQRSSPPTGVASLGKRAEGKIPKK